MGDRRRDDDDEPRRSRDRDDDRSERRSRDRDDDRGRDRDDDRGDRRRSRDDDDRGSRGGSSFRYERRDEETHKKRAEKRGNGDFDRILVEGIKMWKPNDGDNCIRILPPTWGPKTGHEKPDHYGLDIYVHYGVGADRGTYLCLNKMKGKPDPIHEAREEARRELNDDEGNKALEKLVKDLEAKRRVLVFLVDRDHEKEGVQAYAMPWTLDRDIVGVMQDKRTGEVLPIDDPEEGYDITFKKSGSKDRTEYTSVAIARRSSPLGKDEWLEYAVDHPLPDQLQYFDYDHIAKVFGGKGSRRRDDDRDEERGDERPRSRDRDDDRDRDDGRRSNRDGTSRRDERDDDRGGRDRGDREERGGGRTRSRDDDDEPTWASIHDMTKSELEDLIEEKDLDIDPKKAKNVEDLADWVCEEMKIKEPKKEERRERSRDSDDEGDDRLAKMRERRERD